MEDKKVETTEKKVEVVKEVTSKKEEAAKTAAPKKEEVKKEVPNTETPKKDTAEEPKIDPKLTPEEPKKVGDEPTSDQEEKPSQKEDKEQKALDISFEEADILLILEGLESFTSSLKENKRRTNSIVTDNPEFNNKIDSKIKRIEDLRFFIKKKILVVDQTKKIYSVADEGEVIGIETFERTEDGTITIESKPRTVGSTPVAAEVRIKHNKASVHTVSEEL